MFLMLRVTDKPFMLSVTDKAFMLSAIMLNIITLSAIMPNVVAPCLDEKGKSKCVRPKGNRDALCAVT